MAEHILVPLDDSPLARQALERVLARHPEDEITVLHVIDPVEAVYRAEGAGPVRAEAWYEEEKRRAEELCADARDRADEHGVEITTVTEVGKPTRAILDYADEHDVDNIVMGSHGRDGIARVLLGSVAERVIRNASVPVTVVR